MTSFVALAVKKSTVRDCKQQSIQSHSTLTKESEREGILLNYHDVHFSFQGLDVSWYLCKMVLKRWMRHTQELGLLAALGNPCTLQCAAAQAGGFLGLNFVYLTDLWGWFEPTCDHEMLYLIVPWDAFPLIFSIPLGKICAPSSSPVGVTAHPCVQGGRDGCV